MARRDETAAQIAPKGLIRDANADGILHSMLAFRLPTSPTNRQNRDGPLRNPLATQHALEWQRQIGCMFSLDIWRIAVVTAEYSLRRRYEGRMASKDAQRASLGEIFTRDFLLLATINLCLFIGFQMLNVGIPVYMSQLGAPAQIIGLATTFMTIAATITRIFAGAMVDRFGRSGMLVGGIAILVCAIVSFSIFPIVGAILGLRLLHGVGWGIGSTATSTIAADIIPKHRFAEGMGYYSMTIAISGSIAPAASIALVQGPGTIYMLIISAAVTVLAFILAIIQVRLRRHATESQADGAPVDRPVAPDDPANGDASSSSTAEPRKAPSKFDTFFERRALLPGALIMLINVGFGCIITFIALHAEAQGVSGVTWYFITYAICTLASRPIIGKLIDRYGYRVPSILAAFCTAATLVLIGFSNSALMFAFSGIFAGLGLGTTMTAFQAMAVASVEPWRRGVATSTFFTAFDIGIAIGSLLGGALVETLGYTAMYSIIALFPLAVAIISLFAIKN